MSLPCACPRRRSPVDEKLRSDTNPSHRDDAGWHHACNGGLLDQLVPRAEASRTAYTSCPASRAESETNARQTSVEIPAMSNCFRPVFFTAATKSLLSQALISPGRCTIVASGSPSATAGHDGAVRPVAAALVVMIDGNL